jgi:hypothetical protein
MEHVQKVNPAPTPPHPPILAQAHQHLRTTVGPLPLPLGCTASASRRGLAPRTGIGAPRKSPSELNAPAVASKRSASVFFFKAKSGVFVSFSAAYTRYQAAYASQSRTESSSGDLRSFCVLQL